MLFYLKTKYMKFNQEVICQLLKCLKYICVGHLGYRILYAIVHVIIGVGESKVLTYREEIIKKEEEGGRERQPSYRKIITQDRRAKAAVIWEMLGRVKTVFIDMFFFIKTSEIIMW